MKLIPEQVYFLRKEIRRLEKVDPNNYRKTEYENLLRMSDYIKNTAADEIGIGSKFSLKFDDEEDEEVETYILIDENSPTDNLLQQPIQVSAAIGKRVLGKKEGDTIPGATIVKIYNDRVNRLSYLSDFQFNYDESESFVITESQKLLLEREKRRNYRIINKYEPGMGAATERIVKIEEILNRVKIAEPSGDTIETGSVFNVTLFVNEQEITKTVQMIDRVVSTELENEYIVKNSELGKAVLGLKNQDEFIVTIEGKQMTGVVFDISKDFASAKEVFDNYQYRKRI